MYKISLVALEEFSDILSYLCTEELYYDKIQEGSLYGQKVGKDVHTVYVLRWGAI